MSTRARAALAFVSLLSTGTATVAGGFSGITVFGDSLSDSGQFAGVFGLPGTFTNPAADGGPGSIYLDRLAERYGFSLAPSTPLLGAPAADANNYAVGGYRVDQVLASVTSESRVELGPLVASRPGYLLSSPVADRNRLYLLWAGGNDIRDGSDPVTQADKLLAGIEALRAAGARYLLVNNLPDIGEVPESALLGNTASRSADSRAFNQRLSAGVGASQANVIFADINGLLGEALAEPTVYGFAPIDHRQVCYQGLPSPFVSCNQDPVYGAGGASQNVDAMLFYDGIHPTQAGHRLLGEYLISLLEAPTLVSTLAEVPLAPARAHHRTLAAQLDDETGLSGWRGFVAGSLGRVDADAEGLSPGWDQDGYQLTLGAVHGYANGWRAGLALGIAGEQVDFAARRGSFELRSYYLSAFGGYRGDRWFTYAGASYGWLDYDDVQRRIGICDGCRREQGDTRGDQVALGLTVGADFPMAPGWHLGPMAGLEYQRVAVDGYAEGGEPRSTTLFFGDQTRHSTIARAGGFVRFQSGASRPLTLSAVLSRDEELEDDDRRVEAGLRSLSGSSFELPAVAPEGGAWVATLSLRREVAPGLSLGADYRYAHGDDYAREYGLGLSLAMAW